MARSLRSLVAALGLAVLTAAPAAAAAPVSVDPAVGGPETAFHVEVRATFRIAQPGRDGYWFVVHGPGGSDCQAAVTERVGVLPPRRANTVAVDLPGVRVVTKRSVVPGPWCVGQFSGHVEFRDWRPGKHRYVAHRIGVFTFRVQQEQQPATPSGL